MKKPNSQQIIKKGSLHSHGLWTDYRNWHEKLRAPFNLDFFFKTCIKYGRDFQGVLDIMAHLDGEEIFQEERYKKLIKTADPKKNYEVESSEIETKIIYEDKKGDEKEFYIIRPQEIILKNPRQHILALNLNHKNNISGGRYVRETLKEIQKKGGSGFLNHALVCGAFREEEIKNYFEEGLILGTEFNGGVTIDSKLEIYLARKVDKKPPLKKDNENILRLEGQVLIVANDDARCKSDVEHGAYTEYLVDKNSKRPLTERLIESMKNEIKSGLNGDYIQRNDQYSSWHSIWAHGINGYISELTPWVKGFPIC
ncbi:MAG: hypothetical protein ABFQ65_02730 [Nanoarchaeota archaeon]